MPTFDEDGIDADLLQHYRSVRALASQDAIIAVLRIGARYSQLLIGHEDRPQSHFLLAIGSQTIANEYLLHAPPLPAELENAIFAIEEQIAAAHVTIPVGAQLYSPDLTVRRIAHFLRGAGEESLSLGTDVVERGFSRLVNVAFARSSAQDGLPLNADFVATLVLLRELLHHLQFSSITVLV